MSVEVSAVMVYMCPLSAVNFMWYCWDQSTLFFQVLLSWHDMCTIGGAGSEGFRRVGLCIPG